MPFLGWLLGAGFSEKLEAVGPYIAFALLSVIGGKMIFDSLRKKDEERKDLPPQLGNLLVLALATSIDAFAVGVTFALNGAQTAPQVLWACLLIAAITFVLCTAGFFVGRRFGGLFSGKAALFGGGLLILIGVKMLVEHLI